MQPSDIDSLTDDEAITSAMLLGGLFKHHPHVPKIPELKPWACYSQEQKHLPWRDFQAPTKAEAARFFLRRKLLRA